MLVKYFGKFIRVKHYFDAAIVSLSAGSALKLLKLCLTFWDVGHNCN